MEDPARVIICESKVPFVTGGAELHVENLAKAVKAEGLHTDVLTMPYEWDPPEKILKSCLLWRMLDLEETPTGRVDLLLATKFPTYAAKHYNKVAWVFHQHRSAYELEGTIYDDFSRHDGAREFRELIAGIVGGVGARVGDLAGVGALEQRDDGPYSRINHLPAGLPPGLDHVGCGLVGGDAVGHAADQRIFVGLLCEEGQ